MRGDFRVLVVVRHFDEPRRRPVQRIAFQRRRIVADAVAVQPPARHLLERHQHEGVQRDGVLPAGTVQFQRVAPRSHRRRPPPPAHVQVLDDAVLGIQRVVAGRAADRVDRHLRVGQHEHREVAIRGGDVVKGNRKRYGPRVELRRADESRSGGEREREQQRAAVHVRVTRMRARGAERHSAHRGSRTGA